MHGLTVDDAGTRTESAQRLQFRSYVRVVADLANAGLEVRATWQDWHGRRYDAATTPPLINIEAAKPESH